MTHSTFNKDLSREDYKGTVVKPVCHLCHLLKTLDL